MSRAFTEFVQTQDLPWSDDQSSRTLIPGASVKILSEDCASGSSTLLARYQASAALDEPGVLMADHALFVLHGSISVNGITYTHLGYAHLPARYPVESVRAGTRGAVVLEFAAGAPVLGEAAGNRYDRARLVQRVDPYQRDGWARIQAPGLPPGARRLALFDDPLTGEQTWLLGAAPIRSGSRAHQHDVVEEMLLIEGAEISPLGRMEAGAYFWRPAGVPHGPFGTPLPGKLALFRSVGGPLGTEYVGPTVEFEWHPSDSSLLPSGMAHAQLRHARDRLERELY